MIINNSVFKVGGIPNFHPIADAYESDEWWGNAKRACMEGKWESGKWMPGELFYYVNFHTIIFEQGVYRGLGFPWLRDIDWEKAFIYTEASGFSGFTEDDEFSCHRGLSEQYKMSDELILKFCTDTQTQLINTTYLDNFYKKDGTKKKYVPANEYLRKIHKKALGKPVYLNEAKHIMELGSRGYGKSFNSSGNIAHNFLFDGARDYDEHLSLRMANKPLQTETVVGAIHTNFSNKLMDKVRTGLERLPGSTRVSINGEMQYFPSPLSVNYTGSLAVGREMISVNSKSKIQHVTFGDNPLVASGGRPNKIFYDEVGFAHNILETWESIVNTQAAESFKRLTIHALGTGGLTSGGAVMFTQKIFYDPETYNCLVFEDEWEKRGKIGYFVSGIYAMNEYKEGINLITNKEKALDRINKDREAAKKTKSSTKIQGTIINKPIAPSEIFLRMEGNYFPTIELKEALSELESNPIKLKSSYKVDLLEKTKNNISIIPSEKDIITAYPLTKSNRMDACIEIFQKPKTDSEGRVISNRYIMSTDPVDDDGNEDVNRSLQSTFILDTWTDEIVAEYTARTYLASEYYENVRKLCIYYNAKNLYENNRKGMYGYFKNKSALIYLAETPQILKDQELIKSTGIGNRSLGINMSNDKIKIYGINLILEWLEAPSYRNPEVKNMYSIRSQALLKELISFSMTVNADRVSALIALMIFRAELDFQIEAGRTNTIKTVNQSEFWGRAFGQFNKDKVHSRLNNYIKDYDIK